MSRYIKNIQCIWRRFDLLQQKQIFPLQSTINSRRFHQLVNGDTATDRGHPSRHCKRTSNISSTCANYSNSSSNDNSKNSSHLFMPVQLEETYDPSINVGEEIVGPLNKSSVHHVLNEFYRSLQMKELALEHGLDEYIYQQVYISFRKHCIDAKNLSTDLHIILSDVINGAGHVHDVFPSFLQHSKRVFPHLVCLDDLCKISDLSNPPNWYSDARLLSRKIVFHAGPTNSGKTYHAMEHFLQADSGIYCGPLKLLASEVFNKSNEKGTTCDLVTGEERRYGRTDGLPSTHTACTVEMAAVTHKYDVAIIDEIQLLRDPIRGWAWTRALLGLCAREVHVCGEEAALPLVQELAQYMGEELEVRRYKRLTQLTVETKALGAISNVRPGDCIVCFNKRDIHSISTSVERLGHQVAVIYGGLPPGTKIAQAQKFNDPNNPCKVMVATDAIGMGLNLSIRRIIFCSTMKTNVNEKGEKEMDTISVSQALQIAGRAGRYGTQWDHGYVTTLKPEDLPTLQRLLSSTPEEITKAGLHPTAEQIELFAYQIPNYTLSNLIDIFVNLCTVDSSLYFMCGMDDFKFLADLIQHVPLPLRARYVFCCAPINKRMQFVCAMFLKFARQFSNSEAASLSWLCREVKWPLKPPHTILDLVHLEQVFDVFDLYLWFSYRFPDMFPESEAVREVQSELDQLIERSVACITTLLRNSEPKLAAAQFLDIAPQSDADDVSDSEEAYVAPPFASGKATTQPQHFNQSEQTNQENVGQYQPQQQHFNNTKVPQQQRSASLFFDPDDHSLSIHTKKGKKRSKGSSSGGDGAKLPTAGRGRLTEHLLSQGLLSPQMLAELQREWMNKDTNKSGSEQNKKESSDTSSSKSKKKRKGGPRR